MVFRLVDLPRPGFLHLPSFGPGILPGVGEDRLKTERFGLGRDAPRMFDPVRAVHLQQPHHNLRVPVKTVAVVNVLRMVEVMPGILRERGIRLVQHLAQVEATRGKRHQRIRVRPHEVAASRPQRRQLLGARQWLTGFRAKHRIHPLVKSRDHHFRITLTPIVRRAGPWPGGQRDNGQYRNQESQTKPPSRPRLKHAAAPFLSTPGRALPNPV